MSRLVKLLGLDFGTTTSSAVVATARLTRNSVTGRTELDQVQECYRSDLVFTPLQGERLEVQRLERYLDDWLAAGEVRPEEVFGGGALLTGLTAQRDNASALVHVIRQWLGNALVVTADDPCLESWLAFMGNSAALSRQQPDRLVLNLDIGGGTTNLALGQRGEVRRTGCLFVGARHVQVEPGGYRLVRLSRFVRALFDHLAVRKDAGDSLTEAEVGQILDFYMDLLEAAAAGNPSPFQTELGRLHQQVPFDPPPGTSERIVTFSGGVGELVYGHLRGEPWPPTTFYGDLGIDLARRLVQSSFFARQVETYRPASAGRATIYGLLRHNTEISGSTLFLPRPEILPLLDLPVLGAVSGASTDAEIREVFDLASRCPRGACVRVCLAGGDAASVRGLGKRLAQALRTQGYPAERPLVLLLRENLGKTLGHYVTEWGALPLNLVVIDEVPMRDARFVQIGRPREQVVPVSFYGLHEQGDAL